jgi:hypothetical protein
MKQTTLLIGALAIAVIATATPAFAMRDPGPGGMAMYNYGPQPPRIGQAGLNNQYADGMSLYQYVRSNPCSHTDPHGLLSSDNTFDCHGVADLRVKTDYCCAPEVPKIETAVRSAYMTLRQTKDAMWPLKDPWPNLTQHARAHQRFLNFFNQGNPFAGSGSQSAEDVRQNKVGYLLATVWEIIDDMDDGGGIHFVCEQGQAGHTDKCTGNEAAWRVGNKIHVCASFYRSTTAANTETLLHELSHLFASTNDDNDWKRVYGGSPEDTYITTPTTGTRPVNIPGVPQYTHGLPDNPFEHADTIAVFSMGWYYQSY